MNVADLIEELSTLDPDMEVCFTYDYGDHCHHIVAAPVRRVEIIEVKPSAYTQTDCVIEEDDSDEFDSDETKEARATVVGLGS